MKFTLLRRLSLLLGLLAILGILAVACGEETQPAQSPAATITPSATTTPTASPTAQPVKATFAASRFLGNPGAPVKIVEYSDFQCSHCKRVQEKVARLVQDYVAPGKASLEFRNFALSEGSVLAAEASLCAEEQSNYGAYHDALYRTQGSAAFNAATFQELAKEVGLDTAAFNDCLSTHRYRQEVLDERQEGLQAGVTGTPSFLVNETLIIGNVPYQDFVNAIEAELQRASGGGS